ncbi:MAG TPA: rhomboid family intramembrane serine protease [Prolixibacteraceae bacterium]|nr:rhomboid family intramembrane serine protease [Prolixibacteraceae bacterium]
MSLLSRYYPGSNPEEQYNVEKRIGIHAGFVSVAFITGLWLIKLIEFEYDLDFSGWGIRPRVAEGLYGILFSPLIHGSFGHLAANTFPLLILTFSLFFFYRKSSYLIFFLIYLFSGLLVWLGGRDALHIGASGLIYGHAAFLFLSGVLSHNTRLLTISLIVAFFYGGLFWGIFPIKPEVSWESHLWGALSGFGLAFIYRSSVHPDTLIDEDKEDEPDDGEWQHDQEEQEKENPEEH